MTGDLEIPPKVRALLGPKGVDLSHDQPLQVMVDATVAALKEKRFGKRRSQQTQTSQTPSPSLASLPIEAQQVVEYACWRLANQI